MSICDDEKKIPETLYHYCSVESLFHILNSGKIWLSNARNMNDTLEFSWIQKNILKIKEELKENDAMIYYNDLLDRFHEIEKYYAPYIFCLSSEADLLSQWRGYANDGYGVAIGFSINGLNFPVLDLESYYVAEGAAVLAKVLYEETDQYDAVQAVLAKNERQARHPKVKRHDTKYNQIIDRNIISLRNVAIFAKNDAFSEENEWRIIRNTDNDRELKFRPQKHSIISYVEFDLASRGLENTITSITLGPNCLINDLDLQLFLRNRIPSAEIIIKNSRASYRASP